MKSFQRCFAPLARVSLLSLLLVAAPATLRAQDDEGPGQINVRLVDVKPSSNSEFQAAIAEVAAAWGAAGRPFFHVYERLRGPNLPGYTIVTLDGAFNDLPPLDIDQSVFDRIGHSINGSDLMTLSMYPELSIASGRMVPGEFMFVRVRTTSPSNAQAYFDWHANELTPALRQAGVTDVRSGRVLMGGNSNTFVRFYYGDSFASAPGGGANLAQSMGQREFERMLTREAGLVVTAEQYMYRFREDLSFSDPQ